MRRRKHADPPGYGRLLDAWIPPPSAGEALGCLATTFTFHPAFFESECLGRMLQLESDPDTNAASYLVEREEKMARLMSATVIVDQHHARGTRSLRWDLIPFRTPNGILHAKLSILLWQHLVRVIVSSSNLTENGYRQNLEIFTVWDFRPSGTLPASLFSSAADFAAEVLGHCRNPNKGQSPALDRGATFLTSARERVSAWLPDGSTPARSRMSLIAVTPKKPSVFGQLSDLWPSGSSPPDVLQVLSPFFDQSATNTPAREAWALLRKRGRREIRYSVTTEPINADGRLLVHAPPTLAKNLPTGGGEAQIHFEQIKDLDGRPLHAKALWLEGGGHFLHCTGSSNFTSAGLGLAGETVRNWELNVASWGRQSDGEEFRLRKAAWPQHEKELLNPEAVSWEPLPPVEDSATSNPALLPEWCRSAIYSAGAHGEAMVTLNFYGTLPEVWSLSVEGEPAPFLNAEEWRAAGSPESMPKPWPGSRPPTELIVRHGANGDEAYWPVEVRTFTDLPPPQELRNLTLEQLLEVLTSALPLHRSLKRLSRQLSDDDGDSVMMVALDPLRRFSRDTHLLERTRRFSLALTGIRRRLESPIPSEEYLQWRLHGPIGIGRVAAAILEEAGSDGEKAFLLGELALELSQVEPRTESGCLSDSRIREELRRLIARFETQAEPLLADTDESMKRYVRAALRKARA